MSYEGLGKMQSNIPVGKGLENGLEVPKPPAFLDYFERKLTEENGRASELICRIQDKLHRIIERRTPEKGGESGPVPALVDFTSAINSQLCAMENNNCQLERVLNHLSEII